MALIPRSTQPFEALVVLDKVGMRFDSNSGFLWQRRQQGYWALRELSFGICDGDIVGLVGVNGSGKSTCSRLIAGVYEPTEGRVLRNGRVTLLTLGTGFNPQLTGRENILLNGVYLGFSLQQVRNRLDEIISFSELGEFIDRPLKTYSSGMRSRLGFSVAAFLEPDILLLDEIMATGDHFFRAKAQQRLHEMMGRCRAVIIVSHQAGLIRKLCNRALWLDQGRLMMDGRPSEVLKAYVHSKDKNGTV